MSSLYILDFKGLLDVWLANIICHSVGCLFILLTVSFSVQKLLSWCSPIWLFKKFFLLILLVSYPKNHCQDLCHSTFLLCYSLMVLLRLLLAWWFLPSFFQLLIRYILGLPRVLSSLVYLKAFMIIYRLLMLGISLSSPDSQTHMLNCTIIIFLFW